MTTTLLLAPILVPAVGALAYAVFGWRGATVWLAALSAAGMLGAGVAIAVRVSADGPLRAAGDLLYADALTAVLLLVIGTVALLATVAGPGHLLAEQRAGRAGARTSARHSLLVQAFLAAMALAVLAANLGVLWVAVEATTIVTAFLVGQQRSRAAVEAAWKYVVICSVGIALALLGTILLNYAAAHADPAGAGLDLTNLAAGAARLDPDVTRIAVALLIVGFGTKAGLVPLHAWLPDAHSQAPAPVSALMSGVLLSVAFYAILRVKVISDEALGPGFARALLLVIALATLAVAASLLIEQRDFKRMLAYSSIEHLGLVALGAAIGGPAALAAVLLHMIGHGVVKAVLFLCSGRILQSTGTSLIAAVRGLASDQPLLAGCFGIGVLALLGFPPFSLFASQIALLRAGFEAGMGLAMAAALALLLVIAAAMLNHTSRMLLGPGRTAVPRGVTAAGPRIGAAAGPRIGAADGPLPVAVGAVLVGGLVVASLLGIGTGPLDGLLHQAAATVEGAP